MISVRFESGQLFAELTERVVDPRLHCADRHIEDLGNFLVRQALEDGELEQFAGFRRKPVQSCVKHLGSISRFGVVDGAGPRIFCIGKIVSAGEKAFASARIDPKVVRDPQQIGIEPTGRLISLPCLKGTDEYKLRKVFCCSTLRPLAEEEPLQSRGHFLDQLVKRGRVAGLVSDQKVVWARLHGLLTQRVGPVDGSTEMPFAASFSENRRANSRAADPFAEHSMLRGSWSSSLGFSSPAIR